ncbi:hypothetical protein M3Y96_01174400 [Aphelenchoides besseyi]|nr:hypothetical protein M3Y96_01174400 [Aphelenchoides besseyi]
MDCIVRDPKNNNSILFENPRTDGEVYLSAHRFANTIINLTALFFNSLLFVVILRCKSKLSRMKPIIWVNCIISFSMAFINLIAMRYTHLGHGRVVFLNNKLHIQNRSISGYILLAVVSINLLNLSLIPLEFSYRFYLIRRRGHNNRRHLCSLVCSFIVTLTFYSVYVLLIVGSIMKHKHDSRFLENLSQIMKHNGYDVYPNETFGGHYHSAHTRHWKRFMTLSLIASYAMVLYYAVRIHLFLRSRVLSTANRRMNDNMNRLLISLALTVSLTNFFPFLYINLMLPKCDLPAIYSLVYSLIITLPALINPINLLCYIEPYRRTIRKWFKLKSKKRNQKLEPSLMSSGFDVNASASI